MNENVPLITEEELQQVLSILSVAFVQVMEEFRVSYARDIPAELLRERVLRNLANVFAASEDTTVQIILDHYFRAVEGTLYPA